MCREWDEKQNLKKSRLMKLNREKNPNDEEVDMELAADEDDEDTKYEVLDTSNSIIFCFLRFHPVLYKVPMKY